jgi:hypothetical protein
VDSLRDEVGEHEQPGESSVSAFLSPPVCAVTAFTLAVVALLGQNAVSIGVAGVLEPRLSEGANAYYLGWGVAVAVQVAVVWLLARRAVAGGAGWEALLGRAAVVLSVVALLSGALVVLGGLLS